MERGKGGRGKGKWGKGTGERGNGKGREGSDVIIISTKRNILKTDMVEWLPSAATDQQKGLKVRNKKWGGFCYSWE